MSEYDDREVLLESLKFRLDEVYRLASTPSWFNPDWEKLKDAKDEVAKALSRISDFNQVAATVHKIKVENASRP